MKEEDKEKKKKEEEGEGGEWEEEGEGKDERGRRGGGGKDLWLQYRKVSESGMNYKELVNKQIIIKFQEG